MTGRDELLAQLNPQQQAAVAAGEGPVLVIAGPGSGKTRVLTHRVAFLICVEDVAPWRVMAVTFTNKAAREMQARLVGLIGEQALRQLTIGTFHAICARILRRESEGRAFDSHFAIFDADDQLRTMRRVLREMNVDDKTYRPSSVLAVVSRAKNELQSPAEYQPPTYWHEIAARAYSAYQESLRACNALDFDDILMETVALLRDQPDTCRRYVERYQHILVDEFQDTNTAQYTLLKLLTGASDPDRPHNLFVVGDEDQSIYRWRGADYRHVERFRRDFPSAATLLLERNYRSTQNILDAAQAVIDRNTQRTAKALWTDGGCGEPITVFEAYSAAEEAEYVARTVEERQRGGVPLGHLAVMYRTNAQSRVLEEALLQHGLPYQLVGATRFYERREVKDALAYLRLAANPLDDVALERIVNVPPRGIGTVAWQSIEALATRLGVPWWSALQVIVADEHPTGLPALDRRTRNALSRFHDLAADLIASRESTPVSELLALALDRSGYATWIRDGSEEGEDRWENLAELASVARGYDVLLPAEGLGAFLESAALVSEADNLNDVPDRVTLLTLHAAKGLEFPTVLITGLEEGTLPHSRSIDDLEALAEERRLFYVGITRARERLYLVHAFRRPAFGADGPRQRSRFLADLPPHVLAGDGGRALPAPVRATRWASEPPAAEAPRAATFQAGDRVRHPHFGDGVVVNSRLRDGDEEVTVAFVSGGVKKLMRSFAKMEKVASG